MQEDWAQEAHMKKTMKELTKWKKKGELPAEGSGWTAHAAMPSHDQKAANIPWNDDNDPITHKAITVYIRSNPIAQAIEEL